MIVLCAPKRSSSPSGIMYVGLMYLKHALLCNSLVCHYKSYPAIVFIFLKNNLTCLRRIPTKCYTILNTQIFTKKYLQHLHAIILAHTFVQTVSVRYRKLVFFFQCYQRNVTFISYSLFCHRMHLILYVQVAFTLVHFKFTP